MAYTISAQQSQHDRVTGTAVRWVIPLLALSLGMFAVGTSEFVMMGIAPTIGAAFGEPVSSTGVLITAYALGVAVGAPLLVMACVRVSKIRMLTWLMLLFSVTHTFAALAPNFGSLTVARFLGGLPHGAYFGVAVVFGNAIVPKRRQGLAISLVLLGLTVANVVGVPVGTWLAQAFGWRTTFVALTAIGVLTVVAILTLLPRNVATRTQITVRRELRSLLQKHCLMAISTVAIGFAGLFTVYTYVEVLMTRTAGFDISDVPWILLVIGAGFTVGNLVGGVVADKNLRLALLGGFTLFLIVLLLQPLATGTKTTAVLTMFLLGTTAFGTEPPVQKRLLDQAPEAPTLAAAFNQTAFNIANALGAGAASIAISLEANPRYFGLVGAPFVLAGLVIAWLSFHLEHKQTRALSVTTARQ